MREFCDTHLSCRLLVNSFTSLPRGADTVAAEPASSVPDSTAQLLFAQGQAYPMTSVMVPGVHYHVKVPPPLQLLTLSISSVSMESVAPQASQSLFEAQINELQMEQAARRYGLGCGENG